MLLRLGNEGDRPHVEALLRADGLPTDGVADHFGSFVVAEVNGRVIGAAGLEIRGREALLRSVIVAKEARGQGLGSSLTRRALVEAGARHVNTVYLLTTTAKAFFPLFGFERVGWEQVPASVRESNEFRGACPSSAVAMRARLEGVPAWDRAP
jgi:amino-acid N-acetyltransferase